MKYWRLLVSGRSSSVWLTRAWWFHTVDKGGTPNKAGEVGEATPAFRGALSKPEHHIKRAVAALAALGGFGMGWVRLGWQCSMLQGRTLQTHQRLLQPAPMALGHRPVLPIGRGNKGRVTEALWRHRSAAGPHARNADRVRSDYNPLARDIASARFSTLVR